MGRTDVYLRHLQVTDFRSWEHIDLSMKPGPTILLGPNGQGKTNLLEAVEYVATLGSHRVATDTPLVRHGCDRALVRAAVVNADREMIVEVEIAPGRANRARINRGALGRPRDILGILRTVLFAPEDITLVRGDPAERRRFLDDLLVQRAPRFAGIRADYDKVLRQRNALLKTAGQRGAGTGTEVADTLQVWDNHLAEVGAQLLAGRLDLVADLAPHTVAAYGEIAPESAPIRIDYRSSLGARLPDEYGVAEGNRADETVLTDVLVHALGESRPTELHRGVSMIGPHRDDVELGLGATPAKGYASHGEAWSIALALRLGSYELLRTEGGSEPVLMLDDVFAELDRARQSRLAGIAANAEQVLVTAAVEQDVPDALAGSSVRLSDAGVVHD